MEIRESQESRENDITCLIRKHWPGLQVYVREYLQGSEYKITGWSLWIKLHVFYGGIFGKFFRKELELEPFIKVSGCTEKSNFEGLNLSQGWCDIALHLYERSYLERTRDLAFKLEKLTGKPVIVVLKS